MTPSHKTVNVLLRRASTMLTLLVPGLVVVGSLWSAGAWALNGTLTGKSEAAPTLADAYGEQFLVTNSQLAVQPPARPETSAAIADESTVSPLKNWSYTLERSLKFHRPT